MATLRLCAEHQEQLNNLQKGQRPRPVKGRKNLGLVIAVLNHFIAGGKTQISTRDVADAIVELEWDTHWDCNPDARDGTGLVKSVGDCLGNHRDALQLERVRVDKMPGVRLPATLIDDQWLRDRGLDPDTCRHEAVVVQPTAGEPDTATEPADIEPELEREPEPVPVPVPDDELDAMLDQLNGSVADDLDPAVDAMMNQLDDPELDAQYYRD